MSVCGRSINAPAGSLSGVVLCRFFPGFGVLKYWEITFIGYGFWVLCVLTLFCVVMSCCSCDCDYGGVCDAAEVCCAGYAESVVLLLLSYAAHLQACTSWTRDTHVTNH